MLFLNLNYISTCTESLCVMCAQRGRASTQVPHENPYKERHRSWPAVRLHVWVHLYRGGNHLLPIQPCRASDITSVAIYTLHGSSVKIGLQLTK